MATTSTPSVDTLLKKQADHSKKFKGQTKEEGGEDYKATPAERLAGTLRFPIFEQRIAEAAALGDQETVDEVTAEYHQRRLERATKLIAKEEGN